MESPPKNIKMSGLVLSADAAGGVRLRTIDNADSGSLWKWKNANRGKFFFQDIITQAMQAAWMEGYGKRPHDFMFMVLSDQETMGCMGFRLQNGAADIYNVILGRTEYAGRGVMSRAMRLMCSFILAEFSKNIGAKVLRTNPAVGWYHKNGFEIVRPHRDYFDIKLNIEKFKPWRYREEGHS